MYVDGILGQTKSSVNRITRCWITCLNLNMNIFTTSYIEHVRSSTRDEDLVRLVKRIDGRSSTEEKELCMLPYINSYERFQELSNILKRSAKQQYLSSNNLRRFRKLYIYILCALNMYMLLKHIGYEPADLTVHHPPPQNCLGWIHFFRMGV